MSEKLSVVGKPIPRLYAGEMVTGKARYTTDIKLPGMLTGRILGSHHPHALIKNIDSSMAQKMPGVVTVITFEDIPKKLFNSAKADVMMNKMIAKGLPRDQYILTNKARYVGDPIAAVAAVDDKTATEALELIEVQYEKLPVVYDAIEAMKPGTPKLHDSADGNIAKHMPSFCIGDLEQGFLEADYVIEETFRTSKQKHCPLEPTSCIASFDSDGRLTVWSSLQTPFPHRRKIAELFDLPVGMVRWITPQIGGAFGNGLTLRVEPICVALARKTGRPVKIHFSREEQFIATESRQPFIQTGKIGVKRDGTITALQTRIIANAGAYFSQSSGPTSVNAQHFIWLYRCPNKASEADIVYTNLPSSGGFRGYGNPQATFVLEQLVDIACEKIKMDPIQFRLKNHSRTGDLYWFRDVPIESCALEECIKLGAEKIDWEEKKKKKKDGVKRPGIGMAIMMHGSNAGPTQLEHSNAHIKFNEDGSATLMVSACDMGQNPLGTLAQIAAEELGVKAEDIHVISGDTDTNMFDSGQCASRSCYVIGNAVLGAAREAKGELLKQAAKMLEISACDLEIKDRQIYKKSHPDKRLSVSEVLKDVTYNFQGQCLNISGSCSWEPKQSPPPYQAAFAEVQVDVETGDVVVKKMVVAHDIGRAINPLTVEGQLEGSVLQGIGYALIEDLTINEDTGMTETDNFTTYKIPSSTDIPEIEVIIVENPTPSGPFGAKSVGESGLVAIAPAIANAIYNAIGIRIKELPIKPEKILQALKAKTDSI